MKTDLTAEQVAEFHKLQAEKEQAELMEKSQRLVEFAQSLGVAIIAMPVFTPDGRTVATWGVQKIGQ